MKRFAALLCVFVIMFQSMSTLCIFGSFYLNRETISKNLCENRFDLVPTCKGQCYLGKQLKENEKKDQKFPDLKQKEIQLFCQQEYNFENYILEITEKSIPSGYLSGIHTTNFYSSIFHPPQLA